MTIDEAIAHAREVAESWKLNQEDCDFNTDCNNCAEFCEECAKEHEQLAEWLEELKTRRETHFDYVSLMDKRYYDGYNKAIDEFAEKICEKYTEEERNRNYRWYSAQIKQNIADIAEQMKAGGENEND